MRKTALITGGSSGLGLAMAKNLQARGYELVLLARDAGKLARAQAELQAADPSSSVHTYACDVADEDALTRTFDQIKRHCDSIDFLVLGAGSVTIELFVEYKDLRTITDNVKANLLGAMSTVYLSAPLLVPGSHILFVSSGFGLVGPAGYSVYATAKAGMNIFADALRREMLGRDVAVHVTCPGDIDTPMLEHELRSMPSWLKQTGRAKPMSAQRAAAYILKMCFKGKYMITPSSDVDLLVLVQKLLPRVVSMYLIDRVLPLPPSR